MYHEILFFLCFLGGFLTIKNVKTILRWQSVKNIRPGLWAINSLPTPGIGKYFEK